MGAFAKAIYEQKYAWKNEQGEVIETWNGTSWRVAKNVLSALDYDTNSREFHTIFNLIRERKFMPGGRYLYASGRPLHQVQNCLLMKAEDSREGWSDLLHKSSMALMTGAGIGIDYSDIRPSGSVIAKTGGYASGPISLMQMVNECGRHIMQGGSRRSAIWAGLKWSHRDALQFIRAKDWPDWLRERKTEDFNTPAPLDMTNISIILDDEFFVAYEDKSHPLHETAHDVYKQTVKRMLKTAEPGFSIDTGENAGESLRNAPVTAGTHVLTSRGYRTVGDLIGVPTAIWTGKQWAEDVVFQQTAENAPIVKVIMTGGRELRCDPTHEFLVERWKGAGNRRRLLSIDRVPASTLKTGDILHVSPAHTPGLTNEGIRKSDYTLGFIYGDGSFHKSGGADLTLCSPESKNCLWALEGYNSINKDSRGFTRLYFGVSDRWKGCSKEEFPTDILSADVITIRSFVAGLFDADGNWEPNQRRIRLASKHKSFLRGVSRALEQLGIYAHISKAGTSTYGQSQCWQLVVAGSYTQAFAKEIPTIRLRPDVENYKPYRESKIRILSVEEDGFEDVFCADVQKPEHSFMAEGVIISNCTEVTSSDDSDICNLGSLNLARFETREEFGEAVYYATLFLLAGTVYSHVPYDKVDAIRTKNRRLGLGLMGIHEWLLKRGKPYGPDDELADWLEEYARSTEYAAQWADKHMLSHPVKTRAIAPTGTIGIIAETTTGIEPIFCVAYKRRYLSGSSDWKYQYVIDPTAKRLIEHAGVLPSKIEDAYSLAYNVEKRIEMQAFVQRYVDHGISSTINLPYVTTDPDEVDSFAQMLYDYLPKLRGVTCYPDGARGGQPLTAVPYEIAVDKEGVVFEESEERCVGGACGI